MKSFLSQLRHRLDARFAKKPGLARRTSAGFKRRRTCLRCDELESRVVPSVFIVNTLTDPSIGAGVNNANGRIGATTLVSLRSAIEAANNTPGNNVIMLTRPGVYKIQQAGAGEDLNQTGDFDILPNFPASGNAKLTILNMSGGSVAVDGNHLDRVFDINPGVLASSTGSTFTVVMTGFTIQNGAVSDPMNPDGANASGGGIRDQGNVNLTLTRMVVTNNRATADGAGIGMIDTPTSGGSWVLTIKSSIISNDHTGDAGGGIDTDGGGTVIISNSVVSSSTDINQGGGIYIDVAIGADPGTVGADMTMTRTLVTRNQALAASTTDGQGGSGGGISNAGTGTMTIDRSVISNNFAAGSGGGFDDENGFGTLVVTDSTISNNSAVLDGGGIHESNVTTISNSTIDGNSAGGGGGGFSNNPNGVANPTAGNADFENTLFINNSAAGDGGAIQTMGPVTTIHNTEIKDNTTGSTGGGVFANGTTLTVVASTIAENTASGGGGGIELQTTGTGADASTITDATIANNSAVNNSGANGGGIEASDVFTGAVTLLNDTINGNFATNGGGVFWAGAKGSSFTVQNTIIAQNSATTAGTDVMNGAFQFTDSGNNLIGVNDATTGLTAGTTLSGVDPLLGPLQNNGGPKVGAKASAITLETEKLLPGSPAIGAGNPNAAPPKDERGFPSVVNGKANIGAVSQALHA
jgi:predicted outer membrane repeat protein